MLEAGKHSSNVFLTLTYADDALPWTSADGLGAPTLVPKHAQLFMKRLLKVSAKKFGWRQRFFLVGEYGDKTWRPHYHAALFGFPRCQRGRTLESRTGRYQWRECCAVCQLVGDAWSAGDVGLGALEASSARYLGGYVTKKMTKKEDPRLDGRFPEFSRQSRGGAVKGAVGIGGPVVADLAKVFSRYMDASEIDVAGYLTAAGGKKQPLGRYLRNKFREAVGTTEEVKERASYQAWLEQMLPLLEASKADVEAPTLRAQVIKNSLAAEASLKFHEDLYRSKTRGRRL